MSNSVLTNLTGLSIIVCCDREGCKMTKDGTKKVEINLFVISMNLFVITVMVTSEFECSKNFTSFLIVFFSNFL